MNLVSDNERTKKKAPPLESMLATRGVPDPKESYGKESFVTFGPNRQALRKLYFIKTPFWLKKLYPSLVWDLPTKEKILYLTFDDGPHPQATAFVLDELKKYNAYATFFCIGKNVQHHPDIYRRILDEGHQVGNHTQNHLNGWKTDDGLYLKDISEASKYIDSNLFRPPYGRITAFQIKHVAKALGNENTKIIMWDVLSADFDSKLSSQQSLENVILNAKPGSIIVFHDSEKSFKKLQFSLPKLLKYYSEKGFRFECIPR